MSANSTTHTSAGVIEHVSIDIKFEQFLKGLGLPQVLFFSGLPCIRGLGRFLGGPTGLLELVGDFVFDRGYYINLD